MAKAARDGEHRSERPNLPPSDSTGRRLRGRLKLAIDGPAQSQFFTSFAAETLAVSSEDAENVLTVDTGARGSWGCHRGTMISRVHELLMAAPRVYYCSCLVPAS